MTECLLCGSVTDLGAIDSRHDKRHPFYSATGPFTTTTANISAVFDTPITPSGWTFSIWSIIYVWLTVMIIYILSGLCRWL